MNISAARGQAARAGVRGIFPAAILVEFVGRLSERCGLKLAGTYLAAVGVSGPLGKNRSLPWVGEEPRLYFV